MKMRTFRYKIFAGLALSAGLLVVTAQSDVPVLRGISANGHTHAHIRALRNQDGTIARGAHNEIATSNWSGYALANYLTGETYTSAQLNWTVPRVSYVLPPPVCHVVNIGSKKTVTICIPPLVQAEYSASWVGIGGYCENASCTAVDNTLIQLGTAHNVSLNGATQYYAWIEMPPADPIIISPTYPNCNSLSCAYPVHPGDDITASLTCQDPCTLGANQTWVLAMRDKTQNWSWSTQVQYSSSLLSAEWIQEAPVSSAGVLPLADFRITKFVPTYNNYQAPNFPSGPNNTDGIDAILMIDPYGETSNPSVAEESPTVGAFNLCWGNNPAFIGVCAAP